ncbi:MAG: Maf family protein [Desulfocapsaceae bacterium]|nr:Maf family protein [Desulfocapsaceae bacterium]
MQSKVEGGKGAADTIFTTHKPLILASGSPRRCRYFQDLGLVFTVLTADIAEIRHADENPNDFVLRMAAEKASAVMRLHPESWVVAADTVVILDGTVLGKPRDRDDALAMLMRLSGREHSVQTGFCIGCLAENIRIVDSAVTRVCFADFPEDVARAYVATGEPLDKAGAYGIQGRGAFLVLAVSGSYANVVGLPLNEVITSLCRYGVLGPAEEGCFRNIG